MSAILYGVLVLHSSLPAISTDTIFQEPRNVRQKSHSSHRRYGSN